MSGPLQPSPRAQRGALARAFLERFFENELTTRSNDLRTSFFWLIALLGAPGPFIPMLMTFEWEGVYLSEGLAGLGRAAWPDKVLYMGFGMVATGLLVSIVWNALMPDRRDASILGVLPLRSQTILGAKLTALAAYVVMVSVGMHALASLAFGSILGNHGSIVYVFRSITAHLVASTLASLLVFVSACAVQSVCLLAFGPRLFLRFSASLQTLFVAIVILGLLVLPTVVSSVRVTLENSGVPPLVESSISGSSGVSARLDLETRVKPWILHTPAVWFLGLYEWILGTPGAVISRLAWTALAATAGATVLLLLVYPLAYRRLLSETITGSPRLSTLTRASALTSRYIGRRPEMRAAAQFFLATVGRVDRHRLTVAVGLGVAAALAVPVLVGSGHMSDASPDGAGPGWLSLPLSTMLFVAVALRVAASLPSELQSTWLFSTIGSEPRHSRPALFRLIAGCCVFPIAFVSTGLLWWSGSHQLAVAYGTISLAAGLLLTEALLFGFTAMPCSRPWSTENASVRKFWPVYLLVFLVFTRGVPYLAVQLAGRPARLAVALTVAVLLGLGLRRWGRQERDVDYEIDVLPHISVLNID